MAKEGSTNTGSSTGTSGYTSAGGGAYTENPFFTYSSFTTDALKEIWGLNVKVGQVVLDQGFKIGQTLTDYVHTQMQEGAKLSQECIKQGVGVADEVKRHVYGFAEKVTKTH